MARKKEAETLLQGEETIVESPSKGPDAPVTTVINHLVTTEGEKLNILTRTNPNLAVAATVGMIYSQKFGSVFIGNQVRLIEQLAISMDGKGRDDLTAALQAGGKLPDSYFESGKSNDFSEAR